MTLVPFLDLAAAQRELADEFAEASQRVLRSGWYVRGPELERFEADFAGYCGAAGGVGVANGTEALLITLRAMGIGRGDEVLVSAHTSIATWLAITHAGARPVPIEPDPATMQIDPTQVEAAIGPRSAALIAVHLYGMPAAMEALAAIATRHGLRLIEDASQAHGARLNGRRVGSLADAAAFSLYPTKNLGGFGDAGVIVANDAELLERARMLANYGERRRHDSELRGYNSRLDELQAALLTVKLAHLDGWNATRRDRARQYTDELGECGLLELPAVTPGSEPVWHQFVIRVQRRDVIRKELLDRGVQTLIHYPIAPHRSVAYASDYRDPLPITEQLAATVLSLPISPQLDQSTCTRVADAVLASVARTVADPY